MPPYMAKTVRIGRGYEMKIDSHESIASAYPWLTILFCVGIGSMIGTTSCSNVPDWSHREARHASLTVHYGPNAIASVILLPSSTPDLLIEDLRIEPPNLVQSFSSGGRRIHLPSGDQGVVVRCRYRLFRNYGADGKPSAWLTPSQLFPGATRIDRNQ